MTTTKKPIDLSTLMINVGSTPNNDPATSPPFRIRLSPRPTEISGVYLGYMLSHDLAIFQVNGEPSKKWDFVADPTKCDIEHLRKMQRVLANKITELHQGFGSDPHAWTDEAKALIITNFKKMKAYFKLESASRQNAYFERGATPPMIASDQARRPRPNRTQQNILDLGEFMLPEDEA